MTKQTLEHYEHEDDINAFFLKHAAKLMKVHHRTLRRWRDAGKVSGWQSPIDKYWYFNLEEINKVRSGRGMEAITSAEAIAMLKEMY